MPILPAQTNDHSLHFRLVASQGAQGQTPRRPEAWLQRAMVRSVAVGSQKSVAPPRRTHRLAVMKQHRNETVTKDRRGPRPSYPEGQAPAGNDRFYFLPHTRAMACRHGFPRSANQPGQARLAATDGQNQHPSTQLPTTYGFRRRVASSRWVAIDDSLFVSIESTRIFLFFYYKLLLFSYHAD